MDKLLKLANGYKTLIGLMILILVSVICMLTGIDVPNFEEPQSWPDLIKLIALSVGGMIAGTGWADKIAKARTEELRKSVIAKSPVLQAGEEIFPRK
jgi:UDP-N-acetylmuramyl pentapeptide phosphotransferase/UDP-N-acetylglucosamine-1-phosphate transferase